MTKLVLLPGMDGTGELFDEFVTALGPGAQVQIVSYPVDRGLGYAELESLVRAALPTEEPYVLLAESFSGPIGISIAAAAASGLVGLILVCSFSRRPRWAPAPLHGVLSLSPVWAAPISLTCRFVLRRYWSSSLETRFRHAVSRVRPVAWRARLRAVLDVDVSDRLAKIVVPVLCLSAAQDVLVPKSALALILKQARSAKVVELAGPHFLLQAKPSEAAAAVSAFLNEVSIAC